MATVSYMTGRRRYQRAQGMLWADNAGTIITTSGNVYHIPNGYEVGTNPAGFDATLLDQFIILSDHNRSPIDFSNNRIENRQRMINGRMRSYHIADKLSINVSWDLLPSRAYRNDPLFITATTNIGKSAYYGAFGKPNAIDSEFTADGGAGGVELLDWYDNHPGSFWVYLAYDNYKNFESVVTTSGAEYNQLAQYSQVVEVFFSDFQYSVQKRGATNADLWNISVTLEEV
jgi:hypothetical protein